MVMGRLNLTLLAPVLITRPNGGDPNSEVSLDYVPGSVVRGAFVAHYDGMRDAADPDFRHLFLDGSIHYLNAYPVHNGERCLPVPTSWQVEKEQAGDAEIMTVYDLANAPSLPDVQLKSASGAFVPDAGGIKPLNPKRDVSIHIARADRQRTTGPGSTVFRYDSLAQGQVFQSIILADDAKDLQSLKEIIPDGTRLAIGRSHRADYGGVLAEWVSVPNGAEQGEYRGGNEDSATPERITITLLSSCLVRDSRSGAYVDSLRGVLDFEPTAAYVETEVVGGFNRRWNLPLPQATAIKAGSVFVYDYDKKLWDAANKLVKSGIGERRTEGFGRIAVNWHTEGVLDLAAVEPEGAADVGAELTGVAADIADRMLQRMAERVLDDRLVGFVNRQRLEKPPSNSQLARLRATVARDYEAALQARQDGASTEVTTNQMSELSDYLDEKQMRKPVRDQLRQASLGGEPWLLWLQALAAEPKQVWTHLDYKESDYPRIGVRRASPSGAVAIAYSARLIDAICRLAARGGEG